jgi:hypothetical protein
MFGWLYTFGEKRERGFSIDRFGQIRLVDCKQCN